MIRPATAWELLEKGFIEHNGAEDRACTAVGIKSVAQRRRQYVAREDLLFAAAAALGAGPDLIHGAARPLDHRHGERQPIPRIYVPMLPIFGAIFDLYATKAQSIGA